MWRLVFVLSTLQLALSSPIPPCEQIKGFIFKELKTLSKEAISEAAELLQSVLDNAELLTTTDADRQKLEELATFVDSIRDTDDSEELSDLLGELEDLLLIDDVSREIDEEEDELFNKLLRQLGFDAFERTLEKKLAATLKQIDHHFESFLKRQKDKNPDMAAWYKEFKYEKDIEIKLELLTELLQNMDCY